MKEYKNKSLGDTISTVGSMLLFLLFAGCLLLMIAIAAGTYSRISTNFDKTFGSSATLRYISNKVKSAERVEIVENGTALYLTDGEITNVIYFRNSSLYEKSIPSDTEPKPDGGDKIFDISELNITEQGGLLKISVTINGETNSAYIRG